MTTLTSQYHMQNFQKYYAALKQKYSDEKHDNTHCTLLLHEIFPEILCKRRIEIETHDKYRKCKVHV